MRKRMKRWLFGDGDYGFVDKEDMPQGEFAEKSIAGSENVGWAITGDYQDRAKNHCGAVCMTNVVLLFADRGHRRLLTENHRDKTFESVHQYIPDGPQPRIARKGAKYFRSRQSKLCYKSFRRWENIKNAITADCPVALLLVDGLFSWHWVLAVGYRRYQTGEAYLQIVTGWQRKPQYYQMDQGSFLFIATMYRAD